jgi:Sec-independent protein translocase protein TatA
MRYVPLPELIVVLVIALLVFGPRTLWRMRRPFWSRSRGPHSH